MRAPPALYQFDDLARSVGHHAEHYYDTPKQERDQFQILSRIKKEDRNLIRRITFVIFAVILTTLV